MHRRVKQRDRQPSQAKTQSANLCSLESQNVSHQAQEVEFGSKTTPSEDFVQTVSYEIPFSAGENSAHSLTHFVSNLKLVKSLQPHKRKEKQPLQPFSL